MGKKPELKMPEGEQIKNSEFGSQFGGNSPHLPNRIMNVNPKAIGSGFKVLGLKVIRF